MHDEARSARSAGGGAIKKIKSRSWIGGDDDSVGSVLILVGDFVGSYSKAVRGYRIRKESIKRCDWGLIDDMGNGE